MCEENLKDIQNISKDPVYFKNLIGKKVEVELTDNNVYSGLFYCIDPVSETIILVNKDNETYNTDLLLGTSIKNINILSEEISNDEIFQITDEEEESRCSENKIKIKNWLKKHLIKVEDIEDVLYIGDDLKIYPPYLIENCISSNTIILQRVQDILSKMPKC